ncbi:uncharacterized protein LOC123968625 [Micropterus dolomieu]|uniref:uncharacterized protein LOC123968625 n=1 Tax=Micropterus dolomieu TaxID=147949 RepID=UPI001E8CE6A0|nr:uncharacterized protein LOC123968625 [Micropterus dolomieu]
MLHSGVQTGSDNHSLVYLERGILGQSPGKEGSRQEHKQIKKTFLFKYKSFLIRIYLILLENLYLVHNKLTRLGITTEVPLIPASGSPSAGPPTPAPGSLPVAQLTPGPTSSSVVWSTPAIPEQLPEPELQQIPVPAVQPQQPPALAELQVTLVPVLKQQQHPHSAVHQQLLGSLASLALTLAAQSSVSSSSVMSLVSSSGVHSGSQPCCPVDCLPLFCPVVGLQPSCSATGLQRV